MQGTTANNTRHTLAVTQFASSPAHTHLVAIPCANSAFVYGLNAAATPNMHSPFVHLFRTTPTRGLVTCSGVMFAPTDDEDPLLAVVTISADDCDLGTPMHVSLVSFKCNPLEPEKVSCRNVINVQLPLNGSVPGDRESSITMAFHPTRHNIMIVCPRISDGACFHMAWNEIGEYDVASFSCEESCGPVTCCQFSPHGDILLTSDAHHVVRVWSVDVALTPPSGADGRSTDTDVTMNFLHCLAPFSISSGHVTCMNWYVDQYGRDHVVAGHCHGCISVWSGAEKEKKKKKKEEEGERGGDGETVMHGTLTEYPSLHGSKSSNGAVVKQVHCGLREWMTFDVRGRVRTWPLREGRKDVVERTKTTTTTTMTTKLATLAMSQKSKSSPSKETWKERSNILMTPGAKLLSVSTPPAPSTHSSTHSSSTPSSSTPSSSTPSSSTDSSSTRRQQSARRRPMTPLTIKVQRRQQPKHVPFGTSSSTLRTPTVGGGGITKDAIVTSHRFSSSNSAKHSRVKHNIRHPPPFPLPTMRSVLDASFFHDDDNLKMSQTLMKENEQIMHGYAALGKEYHQQYVVLTDSCLRLETRRESTLDDSGEVQLTILLKEKGDGDKEEDGEEDEKEGDKEEEEEEDKAQMNFVPAHRRFRLPPSVNVLVASRERKSMARTTARTTSTIVGMHQPKKNTSSTNKSRNNNKRIEELNERVACMESDLKGIQKSFNDFAKNMQHDLNQALTVVGEIIASRPPRFVQSQQTP